MINALRPARFLSRNVCRACFQEQRRLASGAPALGLLSKLKGDLKTAMKNKDAARLSVLRAVLAEVTNAAKTNSPLQTDAQLLSVLRKKRESSEGAIKEFESAKRDDLVEKEAAQVAVMEEYASSVQMMAEDEIKTILQGVIGELRTGGADPNAGTVLKEVFKAGGQMEGKTVDRAQVARLLKGMM